MKLEIYDTYEEVSERAAAIIAAQIREKPDTVLGLPTGETPIGTYDRLIREYESGKLDFLHVTTFNLDEYYPISPCDVQSYRYFMNQHLFLHVNVPMDATHVPEGSAEDADAACAAYEKAMREAGGVDLQVLGIGRNGHIGFNEPGTAPDSLTHKVTLTQDTIEANSRLFNHISEVPTHALTMGLGTILRAKKIIILITGKNKQNALRQLLSGDADCPASVLCGHSDVTVLCDRAAAEGVTA